MYVTFVLAYTVYDGYVFIFKLLHNETYLDHMYLNYVLSCMLSNDWIHTVLF